MSHKPLNNSGDSEDDILDDEELLLGLANDLNNNNDNNLRMKHLENNSYTMSNESLFVSSEEGHIEEISTNYQREVKESKMLCEKKKTLH